MPTPNSIDAVGLQESATQLVERLNGFDRWVARYAPMRERTEHSLPRDLPAQVLELKRRAENLRVATSVPISVALFGASQSGKSLLVGRIVDNEGRARRTLGLSEDDGMPEALDFAGDLNPALGVEATAVVTRFSPAGRCSIPATMRDTPVRARLFVPVDILKALGRGFLNECQGDIIWDEERILRLFSTDLSGYRAHVVNLEWRADLVDAYRYLRDEMRHHRLKCDDVALSQILLLNALTDEGYVRLAGNLFWDDWPGITDLYRELLHARRRTFGNTDSILMPWQAVHFVLDTSRPPKYECACLGGEIVWNRVRLLQHDGVSRLNYGGTGQEVALEIVQGIVSELQIPIVETRLNPVAQDLFGKGDCLDIPGAKASAGRGARSRGELEKEGRAGPLYVLKRGKVGLLFDKYAEELQATVVMYLQKKGGLNEHGELRPQLDKWGRSRFRELWPSRLPEAERKNPSLFLCLTHLDQVTRLKPDAEAFEGWVMSEVVANFPQWINDYGAEKAPFRNAFLLRYPGTLDERNPVGAGILVEQWKKAFLGSGAVQRYVEKADEKWNAAYESCDGGVVPLVRAVSRRMNSSERNRMLAEKIGGVNGALHAAVSGLYIDPSKAQAVARCHRVAKAVIGWLEEDQDGRRTRAMLDVLHCDGSIVEAAMKTVSSEEVPVVDPDYRQVLRLALREWQSTREWDRLAQIGRTQGAQQIEEDTLGNFSSYLVSYLCHSCLPAMEKRVKDACSGHGLSEAVRRVASRRYAEMVLDDFLVTPGPRCDLEEDPGAMAARPRRRLADRWTRILVERLSEPIREGVRVLDPPGNAEIGAMLDNWAQSGHVDAVRGDRPEQQPHDTSQRPSSGDTARCPSGKG